MSTDAPGRQLPTLHLPRRWVHVALAMLLTAVLAETASVAVGHARNNHQWAVGDWLINYEGGFVRRGLSGELLVGLAGLLRVDPVWTVAAVQVLSYAVFFAALHRLLCHQASLRPFVLVLASPFVLFFQLRDEVGGFRKEVMVFAALAVGVLSTWWPRRHRLMIFGFTVVAAPVLVLMHEGLAVLLPMLFLPQLDLLQSGPDQRRCRLGFLGATVTSGVALVLSVIATATRETVAAVCGVLGDFCNDPDFEAGAIFRLTADVGEERQRLLDVLQSNGFVPAFVVAVLLVALAFVPARHLLGRLIANRWRALFVVASAVGLIAMSTTALDWGRFVYMFAVSLFLVLLTRPATMKLRCARWQASGPAVRSGPSSRCRCRSCCSRRPITAPGICGTAAAPAFFPSPWPSS